MLGREQAGELHSARALCSLGDHLGSHAALSVGVPKLVSLASDGSTDAKPSAVATLHKLSTGGDETAAAAMAGSSEAVSLMVDQLSSEGAAQVTAVASLRPTPGQGARRRCWWLRRVRVCLMTAPLPFCLQGFLVGRLVERALGVRPLLHDQRLDLQR